MLVGLTDKTLSLINRFDRSDVMPHLCPQLRQATTHGYSALMLCRFWTQTVVCQASVDNTHTRGLCQRTTLRTNLANSSLFLAFRFWNLR